MNLAPIGAGIDHAEAQPPSLLARLTGKSLERSNRHVESESRLQARAETRDLSGLFKNLAP
jgi:hypothetical protein